MNSEQKVTDDSTIISKVHLEKKSSTILTIEQQISAYLATKGYKFIDLTNTINNNTMEKYLTDAKNHPHTIYYLEQNELNECVFTKYALSKILKIFLLCENRWYAASENLEINQFKRILAKKLSPDSDNAVKTNFECLICYNEYKFCDNAYFSCNNCCFDMCIKCVEILPKIFKCPQCKTLNTF